MPKKCPNKLKPKGVMLETHKFTISINFNTENFDELFFQTRNLISLDDHVAFFRKRRVSVAKESTDSYPILKEIH